MDSCGDNISPIERSCFFMQVIDMSMIISNFAENIDRKHIEDDHYLLYHHGCSHPT